MKYLLAAITIGLVVLPQPQLEVNTKPTTQSTLTVKVNTGFQQTIDGSLLQGGKL